MTPAFAIAIAIAISLLSIAVSTGSAWWSYVIWRRHRKYWEMVAEEEERLESERDANIEGLSELRNTLGGWDV